MSNKTSTPQAGRSNAVAIVTMFFLFAMISFVTNLAAPIGTIWKGHYEWAGMIGNFMNFLAYLFMGIPAGTMLVKFGYKKTALAALAVGAAGILSQQRVECLRLGLLDVHAQHGGQPDAQPFGRRRPQGQPAASGRRLAQLSGRYAHPFLRGYARRHRDGGDQQGGRTRKFSHSPWSFRHTVLGVIGIFFYVGIEVGIPGVLIFYLSDPALGLENGVALAGGIAAVYWLLMLVGRLSSSAISGFVTSKVQLMVTSSVAIVLVLLAIFNSSDVRISMPSYSVEEGFSMAQVPIKALFLVLCGLCTSVMWGSIFNLAVEGLGKYTAQASGIFMMMVVGGGVMPWIQETIGRNAGWMNSYWLVIAMLAYLLYYALIGSRNVNREIPVTDEEQIPDAL